MGQKHRRPRPGSRAQERKCNGRANAHRQNGRCSQPPPLQARERMTLEAHTSAPFRERLRASDTEKGSASSQNGIAAIRLSRPQAADKTWELPDCIAEAHRKPTPYIPTAPRLTYHLEREEEAHLGKSQPPRKNGCCHPHGGHQVPYSRSEPREGKGVPLHVSCSARLLLSTTGGECHWKKGWVS